jgi:hypothetical protein
MRKVNLCLLYVFYSIFCFLYASEIENLLFLELKTRLRLTRVQTKFYSTIFNSTYYELARILVGAQLSQV